MSDKLTKLMSELKHKLPDIRIVHVTTADGIPVFSHYFSDNNVKQDKLAAVASSIASLSRAAAKHVLGDGFANTVIETANGIMLMVQCQYQNKSCVLCVTTGRQHNLGQVRYFAFKLAEVLKKI
ncbi:roadblock/LC7 domain-containing protein [Marinicella gelatinilytica]|uniref:roadblock/LC7 domain-containing protein n=1 Tax=Marinicella gelatinilytica TaxID=2996017 RepID=UPI0022609C23|nr:roadblock/LC7 domain-containing protein [Marinicella gelatinilytica]MCX7545136.1 roadblock/LC7 domain-containing protein [Marinicella gelatinilytica]